ncbi:MAG TPA: ribosome silencing factor [Burkholderiaceae bacterium]|nr:ribosome silencing factor [Burkholderiaceae bacterium]
MTSETKPRKADVQKLQRAIVDGLEDVKGQDIVVFNTEHLSPLFERVIIASGTSNRQTKALASSISDAVKEAGFPKPRIEGEENGEWIIVDCGQAVAHVMQPTIRAYYHLEEIWGGKAVKLKSAVPAKKAAAAAEPAKAAKPAAKKAAPAKAAKGAEAPAAPAKATKTATKASAKTAAKPAVKPAAKTAAKTAAVKTTAKTVAAKAPAKKAAAQPAVKLKTVVVGAPAKKAAAKPAAKSAAKPAAKPAAKSAPRRKPAA